MQRRDFLTMFAGAVAAAMAARHGWADEPSCRADASRSDALKRAAQFLWSRQAADGGWHSTNYAVLRSGQALTPYVLNALLSVPASICERSDDGVQRAIDFLRDHSRRNGMLGMDDPELPEYPCHATADAMQCLLAVGLPDDRELIARMAEYLVRAQYQEQDGFAESSLAYGAWGFAAPSRKGVPEHLDISHTRHVLQALRAVERAKRDVVIDPVTYDRARRFLGLMQRCPLDGRAHPQPIDWPDDAPAWNGHAESFDGGFYFSPTALTANKAGWQRHPSHWKSYATATCDGLLALVAAGVTPSDERISCALRWIHDHAGWNDPVGVATDVAEPWGASLRFYHFAVRSECNREFGWPRSARSELRGRLLGLQDSDGSFVNREGALMKEDDPLLCTALAVRALAFSRKPKVVATIDERDV